MCMCIYVFGENMHPYDASCESVVINVLTECATYHLPCDVRGGDVRMCTRM